MVALLPPTSFPPAKQGGSAGSFNNHSDSDFPTVQRRQNDGSIRWQLMEILYDVGGRSQRACLRKPFHNERAIGYELHTDRVGVKSFKCKNVFCAYCGRYKTSRFQEALAATISANLASNGVSLLGTLTIQTDTDIQSQKTLLSKAYRIFSLYLGKMLRPKVKSFGVSWSFDITYRNDKAFSSHLHLHYVLHLSESIEIDENEVFALWRKSVQRVMTDKYHVSRGGFYLKPVLMADATSFYLSKLQKEAAENASKELSNVQQKRFGWIELLEIASSGNNAAKEAARATINAFRNKSFQHLGKYAALIGANVDYDDDKSDYTSSEIEKEEVITLQIAPIYHNILIDKKIIADLFRFLLDKRTDRHLVAYWNSLNDALNTIPDTLSYDEVEVNLLHLLNVCLGFRVNQQKPYPERL